ncbi:hypothetical protein [Paenibacillus sp. DYY-L-2]|uniref:hypothetical protein n=1 Tax=Paenibacillus sp. DYY-L-2 TaxID=3447013 RepID=UPI003F500D11
MSNFYAQIENGRVVGLSDISEKVESPFLIPIEEDQYNTPLLLGMRYEDGAFIGTIADFKADKAGISANGSDMLLIELTILDWQGKPQEDFHEEVQLEMNGIQQSISLSKGRASLTISSDEPGIFRLRTLGLDRNAELKVVVTDGK